MKKNLSENKLPRIRVAALVREKNRYLVVKHEKNGAEYILFPGGGVKRGETLKDALRREVLEETGYLSKPLDIVLVNDSICPEGGKHTVNIYFRTEIIKDTGKASKDPAVIDRFFIRSDRLKKEGVRPDILDFLDNLNTCAEDKPVYAGNVWKNY
ncbi:MAG: NUDIX domain-containing protein [Fibrobacterota bacterium]